MNNRPFLLLPLVIVLLGACKQNDLVTEEPDIYSSQELSSTIDELLTGPPKFHDFLSLQDAYRSFGKIELEKALKDLEGRSELDVETRERIVASICCEWATYDHTSAFAYLEAIKGDNQKARIWARTLFMISQSHLEKLMSIFSDVPEGSLRNGTAALISRKLAKSNQDEAYQWVIENLEGEQRSKLISELFFSALKENPKAAMKYAESLEGLEYRLPALEELGQALNEMKAEEALSWFNALEEPKERALIYPFILKRYYQEDPLGVISLISKLPEGYLKSDLLEIYLPIIGHSLTEKALEWLKNLDPALPSTTLANEVFIGPLSDYDPDIAMDYALEITSGDAEYLKILLLRMASYSPGFVAKQLKLYEGEPFHKDLALRISKSNSRRSTDEMENWIKSLKNDDLRASVIEYSWPLVIEGDPRLVVFMMEQMPHGKRRQSEVKKVAEALIVLKDENEFVANLFDDGVSFPADLEESFIYFEAPSGGYLFP